MESSFVNEKSLQTLEDLAVHLTMALVSLVTLQNHQVKAIQLGILQEDMTERANTMIWDLRRLIKQYKEQLEATLELLPDDFNAQEIVKKLQNQKIKQIRKKNEKRNAPDL